MNLSEGAQLFLFYGLAVVIVVYGVAMMVKGGAGATWVTKTFVRPLFASPFLALGHLFLGVGRAIHGKKKKEAAAKHH